MCAICGCGQDHNHSHDHDHHHHHEHEHVDLEARIVAKNDALAARNGGWLDGRGLAALNLMGAPGSGKTTLLEHTIALLGAGAVSVIEGDQATANDAARIRAAGAPVVQVNTGSGCHLDAAMVGRALEELSPAPGTLVVIENVGNLVCPALFRLGEHKRVVVFSTAEGEDKPLKYPHMFRAADLILISKLDLLPHVPFDVGAAERNARDLNPEVEVLRLSARSGEGMAAWAGWLRRALERLQHGGRGRVERPGHALGVER